jgi:hypothetical protein
MLSRSFAIVVLVAACASPAKEDAKGQVDESAPPSTPIELGKADASSKVVAVNVQSAHPYTNNLSKTYTVPFTALPSCARDARLHFKVLRTEAGYDYVRVPATGESFDGIADDTWTEWFSLGSTNAGKVRLSTDGSITRHGFEIDAVEWEGLPEGCPLVRFPPCGEGTVDVAQVPGVCECPVAPQCVNISDVTVSHQLYRGFNNTTKTAQGATALYTHPGPADGPETDTWGTVDTAQLAALVRRAVELGRLHGPGYQRSISTSGFGENFTIEAGNLDVTFIATQGSQDPDVQSLIDELEALFTCGGGGLTCGAGFECEQGSCIPSASCICPALYDPQCGTSGVTFGNTCEAGCANAPIAHAGECGIPGDPCGTIMGLTCKDDNKCRFGEGQFTYPWPDAGGTCVAASYCDAPPDCANLPHIAVPGQWACNANQCAWQTGVAWKTTNFVFETSHPYSNNQSVWYQVYLPSGTQAMRLRQTGFRTEANYDFLEVWTWKNGAWQRVRQYSGSVGPAIEDEFAGQYFYLKFVSDSSVTANGFTVHPEYR